MPNDRTFTIEATWKSSSTLSVPEGMTRDEAVAAFNAGKFDLFEDFHNAGAELTDWQAS